MLAVALFFAAIGALCVAAFTWHVGSIIAGSFFHSGTANEEPEGDSVDVIGFRVPQDEDEELDDAAIQRPRGNRAP